MSEQNTAANKATLTISSTLSEQPITNHDRKYGVVVVGAGLAGWGVVDAIRAKDSDIPITLITTDNADRYHKPMLTMAISQNKTAADLIRATGSDAAKAANITLLAQTEVTDIDAKAQTISIKSVQASNSTNADTTTLDTAVSDTVVEDSIGYDYLVLAMGAQPIFPQALPKDKVWHVNHIERFSQLQTALAQGHQHVAIVGAGMVGTEIAEDLLKAGHQITLMDLNSAPLAQMLPEAATWRILQAIESQGIEFIGQCLVTGIEANNEGDSDSNGSTGNGGYQVHYEQTQADGQVSSHTLQVDHIIASTGLLVDPHLPTQAGMAFDRRTGIAVDASSLRTSIERIYAIGDCMSIDGVACRYVAPLRAQAAAIADDILQEAHAGYQHKPPMIRLKNKAISVMVTGSPDAKKPWQTKTQSDDELVLEQFDAEGVVTATATIKSPN
ncbi:FAD-dependent oxidoreductase [Psychrobacter sp. I-STPA10]|uniref:FAD-dependent oxidoreductase n=1 Tax=Psychrobacter sp. I-STPA10 TaxID=2585769 RepID=UPI001E592035|nr:FAD-dependent oxidoreductase [Psychrobacter sp. I-STPA10]